MGKPLLQAAPGVLQFLQVSQKILSVSHDSVWLFGMRTLCQNPTQWSSLAWAISTYPASDPVTGAGDRV